VGAFEGIALVVAGAFLKWVADMAADRTKKAEATDEKLAAGESKLKEKIAEIDKANSTAIATLTAGVEHIVKELAGIRSDMKDHRVAVFARIDRNEEEMKEIKGLAEKADARLGVIEARLER
jgi:hypothetical protein